MATRTLLNPNVQITASTAYSSSEAAGEALQNGALTIQDDLNAIRSQLSRVLDATQGGNWYDDVAVSATGQKRSVKQLNDGLSSIETKTILATASMATTVTVPEGQNYVILNVANNEAPTQTAAVQLSTLGAVVAQSSYSGAGFGVNELALIPGANAQAPKNRVSVVDASTLAVIESNDRDVYGLLQLESTGSDGSAFNDTVSGARVKISFVVFDSASNSIVACPAEAVASKQIKFVYDFRTTFANLSEDAFLNPAYLDSTAAIDITMARAVANQAGAPIPVNTDVAFRTAAGVNFKIQNGSGSKDLFTVSPSASGNAAAISTDTLAINTTSPFTSVKGATLATAGQAINLGVTTGQVDTTGPLTLRTYGTNPLMLSSGGTLALTDSFEAASTWGSGSIALAQSSSDWSDYKAAFGEASLLAGILKAGQMGAHAIKSVIVTAASIQAGVTVTGAGPSANISAQLYNLNLGTPSATKLFLNGVLMALNEDYVIVAGSTTGDLVFNFPLRGGSQPDRITVEVFGVPADG